MWWKAFEDRSTDLMARGMEADVIGAFIKARDSIGPFISVHNIPFGIWMFEYQDETVVIRRQAVAVIPLR